MLRFAKLAGVLSAALVLSGALSTQQGDLEVREVEARLAEFKAELRGAKSLHAFANAVDVLSQTKHPWVAEYMGSRLLKTKSVDRKLILAQALETFQAPRRAKQDSDQVKAQGAAG